MTTGQNPTILDHAASRRLIFVHGKGGVGRTTISQALALALSQRHKKTLWITFKDPTAPAQTAIKRNDCLSHMNVEPTASFEEYIRIKLGTLLAQFFVRNPLIRFLAKAAPGLNELVMLGKAWNERMRYDHVVVDLPSSGYGAAMFQSTRNFSKLFEGGPMSREAVRMWGSFEDPKESAHLIVTLPEEMPLAESIELFARLKNWFPQNPAWILANRVLDPTRTLRPNTQPTKALTKNALDYLSSKVGEENRHLNLLTDFLANQPYPLSLISARPELGTRAKLLQAVASELEANP